MIRPGAPELDNAPIPYGRVLRFELAFAFAFEFERVFEFMFELEFMLVLLIGELGGAIVGTGVARFVLVRFALLLLLLALFDVVSPQPKPRAPIAKTVANAILFIILKALLSSLDCRRSTDRHAPFGCFGTSATI